MIFPVTQSVLLVRGFFPPLAVIIINSMCTNSSIAITRTNFLVGENSFLMNFELSLVYHIFTTNARDLQKNSCETP